MPPKPQVFKTPDGKEFNTRAEWRDYMMLTFYSFKNKHNEAEPLVKAPGSIEGQMFDIGDCSNSTLVVLDHSEQVQMDNLENCRVWISACASSIFIRNCKNCTFYVCCRQLRLRDVTDSKFYTFSMSEVHIETSSGLQFGPFNGGYPEHARHLASANLNISHNLWYDIYDHNDPSKSNANWSLIPESQYEEPWFPAGVCEPAVPRTKPGSVARVDDAGMQSFGMQQMRADAQKAPSPVKPAVAPPSAPVVAAASAPAPVVAAPAAAVAPAVVAPTPVAESILNDDAVLRLINAFVAAQAGSSLSGIVDDSFTMILANGLPANKADVELSLPTFARIIFTSETIKYASSNDMAYVSSIAQETETLACHYTFILRKNANGWLIAHAQKSSAVEA